MKRAKLNLTVLALGFLLLVSGLRPAIAANNLDGIGVSRNGDSIVVTITTTSDCDYNAFLTESKPERIVIDLNGVENNLPQKQFRNLPLRSMQSIRSSQFKTEPALQARVVLDIERPIDFRNYRNGNNIIITFLAVADEVEFTRWESSANSANETVSAKSPATDKSERIAEAPVSQNPPNDAVYQPAVNKKKAVSAKAPVVDKSEKVAEAPVSQNPPNDAVYQPVIDKKEAVSAKTPVVDKSEKVAEAPISREPITPAQLDVNDPSTNQGIPVDTTPKRKVIEYTASGYRDPFVPLIGVGNGKVSGGLPSLENLKLVGILEDADINRALLEDSDGNGYIMKPNDKVQSGYLVTVSDNKAIFQVTEYGWTRTVALELEIPENK